MLCLSLLFFIAFLTACGNICFKKAAMLKVKSQWNKILSIPFIAGGSLFVICPVLSAFCAKYIDFTIMYSLTAMNFVFVLVLSRVFLGEPLDRHKCFGVCIIVLGILIMVIS